MEEYLHLNWIFQTISSKKILRQILTWKLQLLKCWILFSSIATSDVEIYRQGPSFQSYKIYPVPPLTPKTKPSFYTNVNMPNSNPESNSFMISNYKANIFWEILPCLNNFIQCPEPWDILTTMQTFTQINLTINFSNLIPLKFKLDKWPIHLWSSVLLTTANLTFCQTQTKFMGTKWNSLTSFALIGKPLEIFLSF